MPAQAQWVEVAFAAASVVSSFLASKNKSDGGAGAVMAATLGYLRTMSDQLVSLQDGVVKLLADMEALPSRIREVMAAERLKDVHSKIGGLLDEFRDQIARSKVPGAFRSYQEWRQNELTRERLLNIDGRLSEVMHQLVNYGQVDVGTALYLPSALLVALNMQAALGEKTGVLKVTADFYLRYFTIFEDRNRAGSVANELDAHLTIAKNARKTLAGLGVDLPESVDLPKTRFLLGEVTIHDHVPGTPAVERCTTVFPHRAPSKSGEGNADGPIESCKTIAPARAEHNGPSESFGFFLDILSFYPPPMGSSDGSPGQVRQFKADGELLVARLDRPSSSQTVEDAYAPGSAERLAAAKQSVSYAKALKRQSEVAEKLAELNVSLAKMALNATALADLQKARVTTFEFFGFKS
jgi:hypothetical protein